MKFSLVAAALATMLVTPAVAMDMEAKVGDVTVSGAFARATAGRAKAGGGYMMIKNVGVADILLDADSDVADRTELHTHIRDGDVMRMRKVEGGIPVPEKGMVALKPGGYHIMFMGLKAPLKKGENFPLHLTFESAGKVTVNVQVGSIGAMKAPEMDHSKH